MDGRRALEAAAERLEGFARRRLALLRPRGASRRAGVTGRDLRRLEPVDPGAAGPPRRHPERARFTTLVEGRPMQLVVSGWPFDRVD